MRPTGTPALHGREDVSNPYIGGGSQPWHGFRGGQAATRSGGCLDDSIAPIVGHAACTIGSTIRCLYAVTNRRPLELNGSKVRPPPSMPMTWARTDTRWGGTTGR
jgi:hypothetical protein